VGKLFIEGGNFARTHRLTLVEGFSMEQRSFAFLRSLPAPTDADARIATHSQTQRERIEMMVREMRAAA